MKKRWGILSALALLVLMGVGPCERKLPDSIQPMDHFRADMINSGRNLPINQSVSFLGRARLDPASITTATVKLLAADGSEVSGVTTSFDFASCDLVASDCPRGIGFTPNDGDVCDLQGDTTYTLVLDGVLLPDGSPLLNADGSTTKIEFRTRAVPPGYVPDYCAAGGPLWWTVDALDPVDGLSLGIVGDAPFVIIAAGVEAITPWYGYDQPYESTIALAVWDYNFTLNVPNPGPISPPYIPMLVIQNTGGAAYDLSLLPDTVGDGSRMIRMKDSAGNIVDAKLPAITIPANETLFLYVGADGSSYYAYDDSGTHTDNRFDTYPSYILDPPTAFANAPAASW